MKLIKTGKLFKNYKTESIILKISKMSIKNKWKKKQRRRMINFLKKKIKFLILTKQLNKKIQRSYNCKDKYKYLNWNFK